MEQASITVPGVNMDPLIYQYAAASSGTFILNNMMLGNLPIDTITPSATGQCTNDTTFKTFNAGTLIDGFSVLADITGASVWRSWSVVACFVHGR
jgi:hypothetical protein